MRIESKINLPIRQRGKTRKINLAQSLKSREGFLESQNFFTRTAPSHIEKKLFTPNKSEPKKLCFKKIRLATKLAKISGIPKVGPNHTSTAIENPRPGLNRGGVEKEKGLEIRIVERTKKNPTKTPKC